MYMFTTHRNIKVKYPLAVIGGNFKGKTEKEIEFYHEYNHCFKALLEAEHMLTQNNPELVKLRAENEFMLKLLNQHMKD